MALFRFKRKFYHECGSSAKERPLHRQNNILAGLYYPMNGRLQDRSRRRLLLKQNHEGEIWVEVGGLKERGRPD
jgi:hypothetical protein